MNDAWFAQLLERSQFLRRYPAYAGLLATCVPVATDRVPLMAIGRHWRTDGTSELRLFVNRAAIEANPEHFAGVLQHELHHALYGHLDRADLHRVGSADVMELAMETTANEHIAEPAWHAVEQRLDEYASWSGAADACPRLTLDTVSELDALVAEAIAFLRS